MICLSTHQRIAKAKNYFERATKWSSNSLNTGKVDMRYSKQGNAHSTDSMTLICKRISEMEGICVFIHWQTAALN